MTEMAQSRFEASVVTLNEVWSWVKRYELSPDKFLGLVEQLDERLGASGAVLLEAIRILLREEAIPLARQLAEHGTVLYPVNAELSQMSRVIAPPKVIKSTRATDPEQRLTMLWLSEHGQEYYGQWVAIRNGEFLGSAMTRPELVEILGGQPGLDTMITRVVL